MLSVTEPLLGVLATLTAAGVPSKPSFVKTLPVCGAASSLMSKLSLVMSISAFTVWLNNTVLLLNALVPPRVDALTDAPETTVAEESISAIVRAGVVP